MEEVILQVNSLNLDKNSDKANSTSAILGSWYSTPKSQQLQTLLWMYGHGGRDADNHNFTKSIMQLDTERNLHYSSKLDVTNDMDNIYSDQHEICAANGFGHSSEQEMGIGLEKLSNECFVIGVNKREFYSLSWDEIEEASENDELLVKLKTALKANKKKELTELLKGRNIYCSENKNGLTSTKVKDLSLYHKVIMVRDRIWAPHDIRFAFFNNLHLSHRSIDIMKRLALRSVY